MSRNSETIEMSLYIHYETDGAYLVSESGKKGEGSWLPKSQVELVDTTADRITGGDIGQFLVPEWLADDRGWT